MYVPEFNCFVRRLISLCGDSGVEERKIPVVVRDEGDIQGILQMYGSMRARVYFRRLDDSWYWNCGFNDGSAGEIKLRRGVRGFHLIIEGEAFACNELPDYWEDPR